MSFLRLETINKFYKMGKSEKIHALKDVTLTFPKGEMCAVFGPSGSGKSTLLHILGCLDKPTTGSYMLGNTDVAKLSDSQAASIRNAKIGFVLQSFGLIETQTALENVMTPMLFSNAVPYGQMKKRALQALTYANAEHFSGRIVSQLSGGERQRVAIARAIVQKHDVLLADEPTGQLDSDTAREIMRTLKKVNALGTICIIATHNPLVAEYCDRAIVLDDGKVCSDTSLSEQG